jgi:protein-disulfide isomerase
LCISAVAASNDAMSDGATPVLEIDGTKITLSEFEQKQPTALIKARNTFYESEKRAVTAFVDDYLLEQQAKKENLTVDQLLEKHVKSTVAPDPTEDALKFYYEGLDTKEPFEKVRTQILEHVRDTRYQKAKAAYVKSLHDEAKITVLLTQPRGTLSLKDSWARGDANAPVTIVEYADYECPYCQAQAPVLDKIEAEFQGKLNLVYKDTPLPMHPHAEKAAEAARCAGVQGKFWEYHDQLFKTRKLDMDELKKLAGTLKLDTDAFNKCLDSGEVADKVKENLNEATSLQIEGTPTFLINGRFFNGGLTYDEMKKTIEEELHSPTHTTDTATR